MASGVDFDLINPGGECGRGSECASCASWSHDSKHVLIAHMIFCLFRNVSVVLKLSVQMPVQMHLPLGNPLPCMSIRYQYQITMSSCLVTPDIHPFQQYNRRGQVFADFEGVCALTAIAILHTTNRGSVSKRNLVIKGQEKTL